MNSLKLLPLAVSIAACGAAEPVVREPSAIRYATAGCYGTCPSFSISLFQDGRAIFVGRDHTTIKGERRFLVGSSMFQSFKEALAPLKPERGSTPRGEECHAGDGPSFTITWVGEDLAEQSVCIGDRSPLADPALARRLDRAIRLLPIKAYIGTDVPRPSSAPAR